MPTSAIWIAVAGKLSDSVESSIERDGSFTSTVARREIRPRTAELAVVVIDGHVRYIGVSQAGRMVATGQISVLVTNLLALESLSEEELRNALPQRLRARFDPPLSGPYRPGPRSWEHILGLLKQHPNISRSLTKLQEQIAELQGGEARREGGLEVFERDAVASALQVWGGSALRKRVLRNAKAAASGRPTNVAPFLSRLDDVTIREDPQIEHDHMTFPGLVIARKDIVGSVVLTSPAEDQVLTILNCNRQPLEETLGVDLIYYNHAFQSFILVQYKRLVSDGAAVTCYRPASDANHDKELQRMNAAQKQLNGARAVGGHTVGSFRLSGRPFYIKLCESKAKAALDAGMVSGMYVPVGLWRRLLKSPEMKGPRGGVVFSWENCKRRLSNSEFTNLLRHGWIGSRLGQTQVLSEIIEGILGNRRMLILAASSTSHPSKDFRRDGLGRFAEEDDPEGAI